MDDDIIRVQTLRDRVPQAASHVLEKYPVIDLTIEEEDISSVIESILRKGMNDE